MSQSPITQQPTSNNTQGGLIPSIERAILKLGQPTVPQTINDDNPPPYSSLFPESTEFDSSISRAFGTNAWRDTVTNGHTLFKDLNEVDLRALEETLSSPDSTLHSIKIALEVADDQKCSSFHEFLQIFAFVKSYLQLKSEQNTKTMLPESEIRQTTRYDPGVTNQVDQAPAQSRYPDPMTDPFCCWVWWMPTPPTHGDVCPLCCFGCCQCCGDTEGGAVTETAGSGDCSCCADDCCNDCDCGECLQCTDCDLGGCCF